MSNWRRTKRALRAQYGKTAQARDEGDVAARYPEYVIPKRWRTNPYPPGVRHDAWNEGYNGADPLGDHHGRNR